MPGGKVCGRAALQLWCKLELSSYDDLDITNMSSDWRSGVAFCALLHRFRPDIIDFSQVSHNQEHWRRNCELAFNVASEKLSIPSLLDPDDVVNYDHPDPLSIMTYVSQFYHTFTRPTGGTQDRRARSVSRNRGAMQRLMEESRRTRSVSSLRQDQRPESPPIENDNPFKTVEIQKPYKDFENLSVTRRSKKKSKDSKPRVRSLFIDNLDREFPIIEEVESDTNGCKPRHVLSYSSYAMPYRSCGTLASLSYSEGLNSINSIHNLVSDRSDKDKSDKRKSSLRQSTKKFTNFVKSGVEKLQGGERKRSKKSFESKMKHNENSFSTKHSIT